MLNLAKARYAVIFTSLRGAQDPEYDRVADRMVALGSASAGFCGIRSVRGDDGVGITVSYWESLDAIEAWKMEAEHRVARAFGRSQWYEWFELQVCELVRHSSFSAKTPESRG